MKAVEVSRLEVGVLQRRAVDVLTAILELINEQILYFDTRGGKAGTSFP